MINFKNSAISYTLLAGSALCLARVACSTTAVEAGFNVVMAAIMVMGNSVFKKENEFLARENEFDSLKYWALSLIEKGLYLF